MLKKVGYQGTIGSYSYQTILNNFNSLYELKDYKSFEALFEALASKEVDIIVCPFKNIITGNVKEVTSLQEKYNFKILNILETDINHCLFGLNKANINDIRTIISHSQALKQCSDFINNGEKKYSIFDVWNTAGSIDIIIEINDISIGCIASENITNPQIHILKNNIANILPNKTYFYVLEN